MSVRYIRSSIIGESGVRKFDFLIDSSPRMIGLPQEDIDALGLYKVRVEESTVTPTYVARLMLDSREIDTRAVPEDVPFVTWAGPSDVPRISYHLLPYLKESLQCHGQTQARVRCRRSIEIVQTKTCHTHRTQAGNLPTWKESRRSRVSHISLAATLRQVGVVGCAATRATPWRDHETTYGVMKTTPYFALLIAAARVMESIKPGPIVFHINDAALRWHIDHFKEIPATHLAWLRFWDAAQTHEIQVQTRNAENEATVYAEKAACDALTSYQTADSTLYDPDEYQSKLVGERKTSVTEHIAESIGTMIPGSTGCREEEVMFGRLLDRICLMCGEPAHTDICADCMNWG